MVQVKNKTLKDLRNEKNLSLSQVAYKLGIHSSYVGYLERAERTLSIDRAAEMARLYGVSLDKIYELYQNAK